MWEIFHGILLVPQNTLMDMINVMKFEDDHEIITNAMWNFNDKYELPNRVIPRVYCS
jgi:hypothetical protein